MTSTPETLSGLDRFFPSLSFFGFVYIYRIAVPLTGEDQRCGPARQQGGQGYPGYYSPLLSTETSSKVEENPGQSVCLSACKHTPPMADTRAPRLIVWGVCRENDRGTTPHAGAKYRKKGAHRFHPQSPWCRVNTSFFFLFQKTFRSAQRLTGCYLHARGIGICLAAAVLAQLVKTLGHWNWLGSKRCKKKWKRRRTPSDSIA